jgi:nucleoside-diphosphate-sugar epimerase
MKVLITGNMGYVGSVIVTHLRDRFPGALLVGVDNGWFAHCLTTRRAVPETRLDTQWFKDVRNLEEGDLRGFDAVVHLAAVSNDPIGHRFEEVTDVINHRASLRLAGLAAKAGVGRFVFASSCSVYGLADDGRARTERDAVNPLTPYARSKMATELGLAQMDRSGMVATSLRFATACGMSDRLRLDLVLNDFVASALVSGMITVLSDGSPWRPLIHVQDMARATEWALVREPNQLGEHLSVNVGADCWNYRIGDLARAVAQSMEGTGISTNALAPSDRRSYRVDFDLYRQLAPDHQPVATLGGTIEELKKGLETIGFDDANFRRSHLIRLRALEQHIADRSLTSDLAWRATTTAAPVVVDKEVAA